MGVRFAPSPTGEFHIGNLRTAWISWRWARYLNREWVVRFENIDRPRIIYGAQDSQLNDLKLLGMKPDRILVQNDFHDLHWRTFQRAIEAGQVYPCVCSRREIQKAVRDSASAPHFGEAATYNGRCRDKNLKAQDVPKGLQSVGWRFKTEDSSHDFIIGRTENLDPDEKSFVPAYHWACAIDDGEGQYSLLVRASDLQLALLPQRQIQSWLGVNPFPAIFHTSLVVQDDGHRLEKRAQGVTLKELISQGLTTQELLAAFEQSFDLELLRRLQPAEVVGESAPEIKVSNLIRVKH